MTEAEQRERYGRTTAELDDLIANSGTPLILIETEFVRAAAEAKDVAQMIRLLHCVQYIVEKGKQLCLN